MRVSIRPALVADAAAIAAIAEACFGEAYAPKRIARLLGAGQNFTLLAQNNQGILAFSDHFITKSAPGGQRLELDLLAVKPKAQGQGIGSRLIVESLMLARALDLPSLRALVRSENLVMRRLCAAAGFMKSNASYRLYVASPKPALDAPSDLPGTHLVPVETLAYSGIWIEGALTAAAVHRALSVACARKMTTVGTLVAQGERSNCSAGQLLLDMGFRRLGIYDWWTMDWSAEKALSLEAADFE